MSTTPNAANVIAVGSAAPIATPRPTLTRCTTAVARRGCRQDRRRSIAGRERQRRQLARVAELGAVAYTTRPKAGPGTNDTDNEFRVRHDRIHNGRVSLRIDGHMHHIGVGRTLDGTPVLLLIWGYDVRVIHATTGEIIRNLTISPERRYHGTGRPQGGPKGPQKIKRSGP